jgi:hypothetical protein
MICIHTLSHMFQIYLQYALINFTKKPATSARRADHAANIQFNTFDVSTYSTVQYMCAQI